MIVAFLESVKYVGHFIPIAILRIYLGYYFFDLAYEHYTGDFLTQPHLAAMINEWLPTSPAPDWYMYFLENVVVPSWRFFAYLLTYLEFVIGLSLILGFLVRPMALLGFLVCLNYLYISSPDVANLYRLCMAVMITLSWLGAGRCLGIDYFFFKRQRGIWW